MKINIDALTIDGRLFGGGSSTSNNDFQIVSGAFVIAPAIVPEPSSALLVVVGILGLAVWRRRRSGG
jgi:hypothetical protein